MGTFYYKIKISFKNIEHSNFVFQLFTKLRNHQLPNFEEEKDYLKEVFSYQNYYRIKTILGKAWCYDSLWINYLIQDETQLRLEIYGGYADETTKFLRSFCIELGIDSYKELSSHSGANGLDFYWFKNEKLFNYYDDQSINFIEIDSYYVDDDIDYFFEYINENWGKRGIVPNEIEIIKPNNLSFLKKENKYRTLGEGLRGLLNEFESKSLSLDEIEIPNLDDLDITDLEDDLEEWLLLQDDNITYKTESKSKENIEEQSNEADFYKEFKEFEEDLKKYKAELKIKLELEKQVLKDLPKNEEQDFENKEVENKAAKKKIRLGKGIRSLLEDYKDSD